MTNEIIKTKSTGNYILNAVKRTFKNGREAFGVQVLKNGKQNFKISFIFSRAQVLRRLRTHEASPHDANVLLGQ